MDPVQLVLKQHTLLLNSLNIELLNLRPEEGHEYFAHRYELSNKKVAFRIAKKTPKKLGLFVTSWKRTPHNKIEPFSQNDNLDFISIGIIEGSKIGLFVFPKASLVRNKIMSSTECKGKLGFRVYSPSDQLSSLQAIKTQNWQCNYFVDISDTSTENCQRIKQLYQLA